MAKAGALWCCGLGMLMVAAFGDVSSAAEGARRTMEADVIVYGGTSGGIVAAVQVARMGKRVILVEPSQHLGGLTSGGLGATDIGNKAAIGGISREFYRRVARYYDRDEVWVQQTQADFRKQGQRDRQKEDTMWTFEPHVAEAIYREMLSEAKATVVLGERLDLERGVLKEQNRIVSLTMESGTVVRASAFIDATYEGDLMAKAGVSYHVGREGNSTYDETINGVYFGDKHQFKVPIDPYVKEGDPSSGLVPEIHAGDPGKPGQGDQRVQAYNFRMCMTDAPENRIPFPKPDSYKSARYELLLRYLKAGVWDAFGSITPMPNRKTDMNNNGAFSTDAIGLNDGYADGNYATRDRIVRAHVVYQQGLMWFLANDPRVPERVRRDVNRWGLCKDEFADSGGWPHQLYVREARRMISAYVMTQHDCQRRRVATDSVGLAAYTMDSHNCQRYVDKDGHARNEGDVQVGGFPPYPIAYRSIVPREGECANLAVPVCLSASHIAYGSIRMEPVFMVLGQSAATAVCQAIDAHASVQSIDIPKLQERLRADGQVLAWTGPSPATGIDPARLRGVVIDNDLAQVTGEWTPASVVGPFIGAGYIHDANSEKGRRSVTFRLSVETAGRYELRLSYSANPNRATNVPVTVRSADGEKTVRINQRQRPPIDGAFVALGTYALDPGQPAVVTISNEGTDGYVIVDAVQAIKDGR